eukprot:Filipodium_phascolosomae@DN1477_c0_g1_i2.p1
MNSVRTRPPKPATHLRKSQKRKSCEMSKEPATNNSCDYSSGDSSYSSLLRGGPIMLEQQLKVEFIRDCDKICAESIKGLREMYQQLMLALPAAIREAKIKDVTDAMAYREIQKKLSGDAMRKVKALSQEMERLGSPLKGLIPLDKTVQSDWRASQITPSYGAKKRKVDVQTPLCYAKKTVKHITPRMTPLKMTNPKELCPDMSLLSGISVSSANTSKRATK